MRWLNRNATVGLVVKIDLDHDAGRPVAGHREVVPRAPNGVETAPPENPLSGRLARALAERYGERHVVDPPSLPSVRRPAPEDRPEPPSIEPAPIQLEGAGTASIVGRVAETVEAGFARPDSSPSPRQPEPEIAPPPAAAAAPTDATVAGQVPSRPAPAEPRREAATRPPLGRRGWEPPTDDPRALWQVIRERRAHGEALPVGHSRSWSRADERRPDRGGRESASRARTPRPRSALPSTLGGREAVALLGLVAVLAVVGSFAIITSNGGKGRFGVPVVPPPTHLVLSAPASVGAGTPFTVTVSAVNRHGALVRSFGGTVRFTTTYRALGVSLPAQYSFRPSDHGVHSFVDSIRLVTAGSQVLTAVDPGRTIVGDGSTSIRVTAAPATHLALSVPPTATAGSGFGVTVIALDRFGNVATGFRDPVTISTGVETPRGVPPLTHTFGGGDAGVHTFQVALPLIGSHALSAIDGADRSIRGRSARVQITEATAARLMVSAPATAEAGLPFSVTVTAVGNTGTVAAGYTGTVHFTTTDGADGVSLPANFSFDRGDRGMHTFSGGVTLMSGGAQRLVVTDTSDRGIAGTSAAVDVVPPSATRLVITAPSSAVLGARVSVTVTARTPTGAVALGFSGTVQLSSTDRGRGVVLPKDFAFSPADGGVHTFRGAVRFATVGNQAISVSDTSSAAASGTSAVVKVTGAPARKTTSR